MFLNDLCVMFAVMTGPVRASYRGHDMNAIVGRRFHMLMWDRGETQTELARLMGQGQSPLSKKLRGVSDFDLNEILWLCDHFKVDVAWIMRPPTSDEMGPTPDGDGPGRGVRHQGLEPRTRWLRAIPGQGDGRRRPPLPKPQSSSPRLVTTG